MTPQAECSSAETPTPEEEQQVGRMMAKRSKIIRELIQTEKDYLTDLELCLREVVQPLRSKQIDRLDVEGLFSNIESVHQISAKLLSLLEEATTDVEPAMQVIGEVFLQIKGPLEETYKIYCYHHDEAHSVLESYEKEEELKEHLSHCIQSLKNIYVQEGKPNLLDMGSLMIKPIQRVMKYPLLLCELRNSTPPSHPDYRALEEAFAAVKDINVNINELKRRKDLVLKYKKNEEEESLKDKLSKLSIHSISKKSKRVTNHLKILTRGESQDGLSAMKHFTVNQKISCIGQTGEEINLKSINFVLVSSSGEILVELGRKAITQEEDSIQSITVKDNTFNREEKLFRSLEKTVRLCVKNISSCLQHIEEAMPFTLQSVAEFREISYKDGEKNCVEPQSQASNPCQDFAARSQRLILSPLSALLSLFPGPQKLIQKRYDKLLDYNSSLPRSVTTESDLAKREYEALNAQLVEELQAFNQAARKILLNCLCSFITLLRDLMQVALQAYSTVKTVPLPILGISEIQNQVLEEVHNLSFVKDNSATFIERKLSFEKKKPAQVLPEVPHQTDAHRSKLLSTYGAEELYQAKRKCNATQEHDINLLEGDLVAVLEQKDPLGSTSRWLVDNGFVKGYVYSSFLKPYNPGKGQKVDAENRFCDDDFENISLFVSCRPAGDRVSISDSSSSLSGSCGKSETNGADVDHFQEVDEQIFYAVHAFQARSDHELSLQEYQRVHILRFCDLSGNKEWWLAEAQGQKGYVPANYLGKMTYA
ncbi:Rho guanine nucleotide exchange factor 38 [Apodemus speciosus]|uniref:Rho guanine nucleotide exchange factor 38 n=1 Tax=Apodemus speciosus TaxID=105296 RepID=A0ABQ0EMK4_APOSI